MAFQEPQKWTSWLPLAEWWYNTNFHTSLKCTPFQALYGYPPPLISEVMIPGPESPTYLSDKQTMLHRFKENLAQSQARMKKYADLKRTERTFNVGDMVYLKFQPYRQATLGVRHNLKLTTKFYDPYLILEKIGETAYKLQLPPSANIHPIFHVSQLKKRAGKMAVPSSDLPLVTKEGYIKTEPQKVLSTRAIPRGDVVISQWLVEWLNLPQDKATWEDASFIQATFPTFYWNTLHSWFPEKYPRGQGSSQWGRLSGTSLLNSLKKITSFMKLKTKEASSDN